MLCLSEMSLANLQAQPRRAAVAGGAAAGASAAGALRPQPGPGPFLLRRTARSCFLKRGADLAESKTALAPFPLVPHAPIKGAKSKGGARRERNERPRLGALAGSEGQVQRQIKRAGRAEVGQEAQGH